MKDFSYIIVSIFIIWLSSCGEGTKTFDHNASVIDIYLKNEFVNDQPHLKIYNVGLTHDFMLYGAFIPMLNSPTGHSLKGRIVRFQIAADRVVLLESPVGHTLSDGHDSFILLADFPIVRKDQDGVVIDFAKGMNTAFTMRNVHSRSMSDRDTSTTSEQFRAVNLSSSFVKSVDIEEDVLTISQIAQWRNPKSEFVSAEFRYYFRDYRPSPTFLKKTFGKHRWVQYFSTPPLVVPPKSTAFAYVTKWDISEPIVFHLSKNTPLEYRDAIKDGLLFWNHIFGQEIIKVEPLEKEISAPDAKLNIMQWVTWDNEASAYADMVVDHLTGQIIQAQIYLRSGWVIESARKLKNQLEELLMTEQQTEGGAIADDVPLPAMFDVNDSCMKTMTGFEEVADLATRLSEKQISENTLVILTGDILRAVIAHEMGHVLGLRHNLAASTEGNITLAERDQELKNYLQSGEYNFSHDKYISKSIMDVFSAGDDAIVGAQIRALMKTDDISNSRLRSIYSYDKEAIDFGYFDKTMSGNIAFCTDEDIPAFLDCRRWDAGKNAVQFASLRLNAIMTQIAIIMADTFISAIEPTRNGGPMRVRDIPLTSKNVIKVVEAYAKELLLWQNKNSRSVLIEKDYLAFGPQTEKLINEAKFAYARGQLQESGVENSLFGMLPPFRHNRLSAKNVAQIFRAHFMVRLQEIKDQHKGFYLSEEEQQQAVNIAEAFLADLNQDVVDVILAVVAKSQFDDEKFQLPIEEAIGKIAHEIILRTNTNDYPENVIEKFRYELKTRELAVQILNPALGTFSDWSFDNSQKIINNLKQKMRSVAVIEKDGSLDLATMRRDQRQWLLEQNRVLTALMQLRNITRKNSLPSPQP